jgi:hypothetical protein
VFTTEKEESTAGKKIAVARAGKFSAILWQEQEDILTKWDKQDQIKTKADERGGKKTCMCIDRNTQIYLITFLAALAIRWLIRCAVTFNLGEQKGLDISSAFSTSIVTSHNDLLSLINPPHDSIEPFFQTLPSPYTGTGDRNFVIE